MDEYTTNETNNATYGGARQTYMKIEMEKVSIATFDLVAATIKSD